MYGNDYINIDGHAEIPAGVDKIGQKEFQGIKQLKSVSIPDTVTVIQSYAFAGTSLTTITIPDSVKQISGKCFEGCSSLTKVILPKGLKEIGDYTFSGCSSLREIVIPDGVSIIGRGAFYRCASLTKVVLPKSLVTLGVVGDRYFEQGPFEECKSLSSIELPEGVRTIGDKAFSKCRLGSVIFPDSLESIGRDAFYDCPLSKVDIPANVKSINGFQCTDIKEVTLPEGLAMIGAYCFCGCHNLTDVTVPESVTSIGENAFEGCTSLKTLSLPKTLTDLGDHAFSRCEVLGSIDVPEGVTSIAPSVFNGCVSAQVHLPSSVREFLPHQVYGQMRGGHNEMKDLSVAPDNPVLSIEANCLVDKQKRELLLILNQATEFPTDLKSINIPDTGLPSLLDVEELVIPEGVTHISSLPFGYMKKLKKLVLPATLRSCDERFLNDYPFSSISVPPELLLSDAFTPWREMCRVDLLGMESVSDELKKRIARKFPVNRWTKQILCVYAGDKLIHPAANVVKAKEEEQKRSVVLKEIESFEKNKRTVADKVEDLTLKALCDANFANGGFKFKYSDYNNTVNVEIGGSLELTFVIQVETAQEDLAFLLDAATAYRDALSPYVSSSPDERIRINSGYDYYLKKGTTKYISGQPCPKTSLHFVVERNTAESAFLALENLKNAYETLSLKYGSKLEKLIISQSFFYI